MRIIRTSNTFRRSLLRVVTTRRLHYSCAITAQPEGQTRQPRGIVREDTASACTAPRTALPQRDLTSHSERRNPREGRAEATPVSAGHDGSAGTPSQQLCPGGRATKSTCWPYSQFRVAGFRAQKRKSSPAWPTGRSRGSRRRSPTEGGPLAGTEGNGRVGTQATHV